MNKKLFLILFLGIFLIGVISAQLNTNISTYYTFDTSHTLEDVIAGKSNLTQVGSPINNATNGLLGNGWGVPWDSSNYLRNTSSHYWNLPNNEYFTMNLWVKINTLPSSATAEIMGFPAASNPNWDVFLLNAGGGSERFGFGFSGSFVYGNNVPTTGKWYMITIIHNSSGVFQYLNGTLDSNITGTTNFAPAKNFSIGYTDGAGAASESFKGSIDEVGLWTNRSLTETELNQLWNNGAGLNLFYNIASITVNLISPANNTITLSGNLNFTANYTFVNLNITNATYFLWYSNGSTYNRTMVSVSSLYNSTSFNLTSIPVNTYNWNVYACGINTTATVCNYGTNRTFFVRAFTENGATFNASSYEMLGEGFKLNITSAYPIPNAFIVYNGTSYASTINSISGNTIITNNLTIPLVDGVSNNNTFYWNINLTNFTQNSNTYGQNASRTWFVLCNSTYNVPYINFTFADEVNNNLINASIPTSTFTYWINNNKINRTITLINNTENPSYAFCFSPSDRTINVNSYIQYKGTSYPQRILNNYYYLINTTTNKILYLLSSTDGIYVTFQVLGSGGQPLDEVSTIVNRTIGSLLETVGYGLTGNDGGVTFWLNPDFQHTFYFNKINYGYYIFSTSPTQPLYTITLGATSGTTNFTDYTRGIIGMIKPSSDYLTYSRIYSFNYTINSSYWSLGEFGFVLKYQNGTIINTQSSTSSSGGTLNYDFNVTSSKIIMDYYYIINSNYTNGSRYWIVQKSTDYSIFHFFTDLGLYIGQNIFGINGEDGDSNFGMALLSVIILVGVTGTMVSRYGAASEAAIMGLIFGLVLTLNSLGFIPNPSFITVGSLGNFLVYICLVLLIAFIYKGEQR